MAAQKLDNTLYVKMNSRGRPDWVRELQGRPRSLLHKNALLEADGAVKAFSQRSTGLRPVLALPGDNHLIDEEFMRCLRFLFEVRAWKQGLPVHTKLDDLSALLELSNLCWATTTKPRNFAWIARALDIWLEGAVPGLSGPKAIARCLLAFHPRAQSIATTPLRIFNFRDFGDAPVRGHVSCLLYLWRHAPWSLARTPCCCMACCTD